MISPNGPTIQGDDIVRTAEWAMAFNGTMEFVSCAPRFASSIVCTYLTQDDFMRTASFEPHPVEWTFDVVDGRMADVTVFDPDGSQTTNQVSRFANWASENNPDVTILVDEATGDFVHTAENAVAVQSLLSEF